MALLRLFLVSLALVVLLACSIAVHAQTAQPMPAGTTTVSATTSLATSASFVSTLSNSLQMTGSYPLNTTVMISFEQIGTSANYSASWYFADPDPLVDRFQSQTLLNQISWNIDLLQTNGIWGVAINVAADPVVPAFSGWSFNLTNATAGTGWQLARLEVRPDAGSPWGSVCDDGMSYQAVTVMCIQLGYDPALVVPHFVAFSQLGSNVSEMASPANPIYIDDIYCPVNSTQLSQCTFTYSTPEWPRSNCRHIEDIAISCVAPPTVNPDNFKFRLISADGKSSEDYSNITAGRLEIQTTPDGVWGGVCDDNFNYAAATAACKSLGFSDVPFGVPLTNVGQEDPILLTDVSCSSTLTQTLQECNYVVTTPYDEDQKCFSWEAVGVDCSGQMPKYTDKFTQYTIDVNTTMYDVQGSLTQLASYLLVGLNRIKIINQTIVSTQISRVVIVFTDPALQDLPTFLTRARLDTSMSGVTLATLSAIAGIAAFSSAVVDWQWKLISYSGSATVGTLAVLPPFSNTWGTVCGAEGLAENTFTNMEAVASCHQVGFPGITSAVAVSMLQNDAVPASAPIYVKSLSCPTGATTLNADCTWTYEPDFSSVSTCDHYMDAGIDCTNTDPNKWDLQLEETSPGSKRGLVRFRPDHQSKWGTVCSSGVTDIAAKFICLQAGYSVEQAYALLDFGGGNGTIYINDVKCNPDSGSLSNCSLELQTEADIYNTYCTHAMDVGVDCNNLPRPADPVIGFVATMTTADTFQFVTRLADFTGEDASRIWVYSSVTNGTSGWNNVMFRFTDATTTGDLTRSDLDFLMLQTPAWQLSGFLAVVQLTSNVSSAVKQTMTFELVGPNASIGMGVVMVKPDATTPFGTICDDGIRGNVAAARAICHSLGYPNVQNPTWLTITDAQDTASPKQSGYIFIDQVMCSGNPGEYLQNCSFVYSPPEMSKPLTDCNHNQDVALNCVDSATYSFSLAPGTITENGKSGLLLATTPTGQTGTVCGFTFNDNAALAACRALGMDTPRARYIYGMSGGSSYPIVVGRVDCSSPTGPYLQDCDVSNTYASFCSHSDDIGIDCNLPPHWDVQLVPVSIARPYRGKLILRPNMTAPFGFACSYGINDLVAGAACRSAGFNVDVGVAIEFYGGGVGPAYMDAMACGINDTFIDNCSYNTRLSWGMALCRSYEALGLDCSGQSRTGDEALLFGATTMQNASVTFDKLGWWFFVDPSRFNLVSSVSNGTEGWNVISFTITPLPASSSWGLSQTDIEYYLLQISPSTLSYYLGIVALTNNATTTVSQNLQVRLYNQTTNVSSGLTQGMIQVRPDSNADWGTVCDDHVGTNELIVLCKLAGVANPSATPLFIKSEGEGFIYVDDLTCQSGATNLTECNFIYSAPLAAGGASHNCKHYEDVAVDCLWTPPPVPYQFSFAAGTITENGKSGLLLATTPDGVTGTVCGFTFSDVDAQAACRSLGIDTPRARYIYGMSGGDSYPIVVGRVDCSSPTGPYLQNCSVSDTYANLCEHADDIGVDCNLPPQWNVQVEPVSIARPYRGKMILRPNMTAPFGFACSYGINDDVAAAACRSAGFNVPHAIAIEFYGGGVGPAYMDNIRCGQNDTFIDNCSYDVSATFASGAMCRSYDAVGLDCSGMDRAGAPPMLFTALTQQNASYTLYQISWWFFIEPARLSLVSSTSNGTVGWNLISFSVLPLPADSTWGMSRSDIEYYLLQISPSTLNEYLGITSLANNGTATVSVSMQVRLYNQTTNVSSGLTQGMIQVRPDSNADWGTVCDDNIGAQELVTLCKLAGVANPSATPLLMKSEGEGFIYIDNLMCKTGASNLTECNFIYSAPLAAGGASHNCKHYEDVAVDCLWTPPAAPTYSFSLAPGTITENGKSGLLLATTPDGVTGTVCGFTFNDVDAQAACRSIGIDTPRARYIYGMSGGDSYPIVVGKIDCTSPTGPYLQNCNLSATYANFCEHADDIGIDCNLPPQWNVQLEPVSIARPYRGKMILRPNMTAPFGFACSYGINDDVAAAACRSAGFNVPHAIAIEFYGGGVGPAYMDNIRCGQNDSFIDNCSYDTQSRFGGFLCASYGAIGLDCSGMDRSGSFPLLFSALTQQNASFTLDQIGWWFFVDPSRFNLVSSVSNGTEGWNVISFTVAPLPSNATWGMSRSDIEYYLLQISPSTLSYYLGIVALTNNATTTVSQNLQVRLYNQTTNVSSGLTQGMIQVRPDSNADWGTVCDDHVGTNELIVLCKLAGVANPSATPLFIKSEGEGFIYVDDLTCQSGATNLTECNFIYSAPLAAGGASHNCKHYEDVGVDCLWNPAPVAYQFSFAAGTITENGKSGLLLATTPDGVTGTVCGFTFSDVDAQAACRSLGIDTPRARYIYGMSGGDSYPIVVGRVDCSSPTGPYLQDCDISGTYADFCEHADDIGVDCNLPPQWNVQVEPVSIARPYRGKMILRPNMTAPFGFACSYGINDDVAAAACRSAGFNVPHAIAIEFYGGGVGPAYMDNIRCGQNDTFIDNCSYDVSSTFASGAMCRSYDAVGLDCSGMDRAGAPPMLFTALTQMNASRTFEQLGWWFFIDPSRFNLVSSTSNGTVGWNLISFTVLPLPADSTWGMSQSDIEYYLLQLGTATLTRYIGIAEMTSNGTATVSVSMQVRLYNQTTNVSSGLTQGMIQVRPDSNADWGTVCDDNIGAQELVTLCKLAGVANPSATPLFMKSEGEGFIYIDNLMCKTGATNLTECNFIYSAPLAAGGASHNCKHYEDVAVDCLWTPPAAPTYNFSFAPGTVTGSMGLLLATSPSGQTGTVCGFTFNDKAALSACRSIGFDTPRASYVYGMSGGSSYPIVVGRVDCSSPTGPYLQDCDVSDTYANLCSHSDDIGVDCSHPPNWDVVVTPIDIARPFVGHVSVRPNTTALFGFVCSYGIDDLAAAAACRSAGFNVQTAVGFENYGGAFSQVAYLDNLHCGVNDTYVSNCSYTTNANAPYPLCSSWSAFGVDCSGVSRHDKDPVLFTAFTNVNASTLTEKLGWWFFVDPSRFNVESAVAGVSVSFTVTPLPSNVTFGISRTDMEYYILQLSNYTLNQYFSVSSMANNLTSSVSQNMQVRLYNQTTNTASGLTQGMIQVRPDSNSDWGTVCDDNIGTNELIMLCKLAGVANPSTTPRFFATEGQGFIYVDDLSCKAGAQSFADCTYLYSQPYAIGGITHNCRHYEDVAVDCMAAVTPSPTEVPYVFSLAPGSTNRRGLLLAINPFAQTGTVCGFTFNDLAAEAICATMGMPTPSATYVYGMTGGDSYPIVVGSVSCKAGQSATDNCTFSDTYASICTHRDDIGIDCNLPPQWEINLIPVSAARPTRGKLAIRPNNTAPFGFACSFGINDDAALSICHQLNYPVQEAAALEFYGGGVGPAYMDQIRCAATDNYLDNCSYTASSSWTLTSSSPLCRSYDALGIDCSGQGRTSTSPILFTATTQNNASTMAYLISTWFFIDANRVQIQGTPANNGTAGWNKISFTFAPLPASATWGMSANDLEYYTLQTLPMTFQYSMEIYQISNNASAVAGTTMQVRLYNYTNPNAIGITSGIVQVRPDANADWGTMCDDGLSEADMIMICKMAGVENPTPQMFQTEGFGFIYVDDLSCQAGATNFSQCSFTYTPPMSAYTFHNCKHYEDAAIDCLAPVVTIVPISTTTTTTTIVTTAPGVTTTTTTSTSVAPSSIGYGFRIVPPTSGNPRSGLLEADVVVDGKPSGIWGTVCSFSFTAQIASRVCNELGYADAHAQYSINSDASIPLPSSGVAISYLSCQGASSSNMSGCTYSAQYADICSSLDNIFIDCNPQPPWIVTIKPNNAARPYRGLLQIKPDVTSAIGYACSDNVNDYAALAACHSAGYPASTNALVIQNYGGGVGVSWIADLDCSPSDTFLQNCSFTSDLSGAGLLCGNYAALGVDCATTRAPSAIIGFTATTWSSVSVFQQAVGAWMFVDGSRIQVLSVVSNGTAGFWNIFFVFTPVASGDFGLSRTDLEYFLLQTSTNTLFFQLNITLLTNNASAAVAPTMQVRIVANPANPEQGLPGPGAAPLASGLVQVRPNSDSDWGTVCDDSIGANEANMLCRAAGFVYATAYTSGNVGSYGVIYVDGLACASTSATSFAQCSFVYTPPSETARNNCMHFEDLLINCSSESSTTTTTTTTTVTTASVVTTSTTVSGAPGNTTTTTSTTSSSTPPPAPTSTTNTTNTTTKITVPTTTSTTATTTSTVATTTTTTTAAPVAQPVAGTITNTSSFDVTAFTIALRKQFPACTISNVQVHGKDVTFDVLPVSCAQSIENMNKTAAGDLGTGGFAAVATPSPTAPPSNSDNAAGLPIPIIAGAAGGGLLLILIVVGVVMYRRRSGAAGGENRRNNQRFVDQDYVAMMDYSPPEV